MQQIVIPEFEEYIKRFGIHKYKIWSEQEESVIRNYYGVIPTSMLAEYLGRSIKAIQDKAAMMGVTAAENQQKRSTPLDHTELRVDQTP